MSLIFSALLHILQSYFLGRLSSSKVTNRERRANGAANYRRRYLSIIESLPGCFQKTGHVIHSLPVC